MPLETPQQRLRRWKPELVIISTGPGAPMDMPENAQYLIVTNIRTISCRNLTRRVLQKLCTVDGQNAK